MKSYTFTLLLALLLPLTILTAQTPGLIVRPAGSAGPAVLDPNLNGYTSLTTAGFGNNDVTNSEIPYKVIPPLVPEPTGDLLRGPSGFFSDIVKTTDGSGLYLYSDGTNIYCRLRIGGIVSGSKGYSILLDTDQKIGASGPGADPNFQAATNGNNGNPGFEFEIVLETNFRVAIYNVDGTSNPVFVASYPLATHSQISIAATTDGGNPDFFYDFYVPLAAMGLNANSPIRAIATTVMSPGPSVGGPKSDIYGMAGTDYMADWTDFINHQPIFTPNALTPGGSGISAFCTTAPLITSTISSASTTVSGTWTKSAYSSLTNATITLYKGVTVLGTTTVSSGGVWNIAVSGLLNNDIITAKAQAVGESQCLTSNEVTVNSCSAATHTAAPVITCSSTRGFEGTRVSGASVTLYKLTSAGYVLYADDLSTLYKVTYPDAITWRYDDINTQSGSACTGGASDVPAGEYVAVATLAPNCASVPVSTCISGAAAPAAPVITSFLVNGATTISGSAVAGSAVNLWIDGYFRQSVIATGGNFSFTLVRKLAFGELVEINSSVTGSCASTKVTASVSCYVAAPVINANASGQVTVGSQLSGTSSAVTGTTITIYNASTTAVIGTTTVQANGSWTLSTPVVAAATTYNARVTGHACGSSTLSNTVTAVTGTSTARCGTITGPVNEFVASVSGTVTTGVANTTVILYVDGVSVGSNAIAGTGTAWTILVNTTINNTIYPGAVLTIGIAETGKTEISCAATQTVTCVPPAAPSVSPLSTTIAAGQTVTYTISTALSGIMYSIKDNADANNIGESKFGNGSSINITTEPFNVAGTYTVKLKATSFTGLNCLSVTNATVTVTGVLPLSFSSFTGKYENGIAKLNWETSFEQDIHSFEIERSFTAADFKKIGTVNAAGNSQVTQFYNFNDIDAKATLIYYRLKIIDKSIAGFKYSKVLVLRADKGIILSPVSPNPFEQSFQLNFDAVHPSDMIIRVSDMAGRLIKTQTFKSRKGLNLVAVNDLGKLPSGVYVMEVIADGEKLYKQLLLKK